MKLAKGKKTVIIVVILAVIVLLFNSNTVFAEINKVYPSVNTVSGTDLDEVGDDNALLEALTYLIYAVARLVEWLLSTLFKMLTGSQTFPWADKIVFNAVPLLDVNFMNPSDGSFVIKIVGVIKNTYTTVLSLSLAFFGILVLITAIKLVITTIASEKARYKKAIVDWLIGFVLLFCIHYGISFILYLNEQLVKVASSLALSQLEGAESALREDLIEKAEKIIENAYASEATYNSEKVGDILKRNKQIVEAWAFLDSDETSKGLYEAITKDIRWWSFGADVARNKKKQFEQMGMIVSWAAEKNVSTTELSNIKTNNIYSMFYEWNLEQDCLDSCSGTADPFGYLGCLIGCNFTNAIDVKKSAQVISDKIVYETIFADNEQLYDDFLDALYYDGVTYGVDPRVYTSEPVEGSKTVHYLNSVSEKKYNDASSLASAGAKERLLGSAPETNYIGTNFYWTDVLNDLITLKSASATANGSTSTPDDGSGSTGEGGTIISGKVPPIISDLATYFKKYAHDKVINKTGTGFEDGDNPNIQNKLMFAILVGQSVILFIAYIKRLFYVIILAISAPVVVVFDFFQKFGK